MTPVTQFALLVACFCPPWMLLFWAIGLYLPMMMVTSSFCAMISSMLLDRAGHPNYAVNVMLSSVVLTLVVNSLFTGCAASPLLSWLAITPGIAIFLRPKSKLAVVYAGVSLAAITALYVDRSLCTDNIVPAEYRTLMDYALKVSLLVALTAICMLYQRLILELIDARTEFIARISHELRTPLFGLLGSAELLEPSEHKKTILGCGRLLLAQVNNVLDIPKVHLERRNSLTLTQNRVPTQMDSLLAPVRAVASMRSDRLVRISVHEAVPRRLLVDGPKCSQILVNLLANALRHSESRVTLEASERRSGRLLVFRVSDDGPGIPEERRAAVFDAWVTCGMHGGTGLGLSISRELAESMRGSLRLLDSPRGALFELCVPLGAMSLQKSSGADEERGSGDSRGRLPESLLLVEDNPINQRLARAMLQRLGVPMVRMASSGEQAVAAASVERFQVILMDLGLPGPLDGIQAAAQILLEAQQSGASRPVIVACTADGTARRECFEAGLEAFLSKPFDMQQLRDAITLRQRGAP